MAGFKLSTMQGVTRQREKDEQARLAEARGQKRKVNARREQLQWDMAASSHQSSTSAALSSLVAARTNRLTQSFQLDALLHEKELAVVEAEKRWSDAAQRAAAIDKLHAKFLLEQRTRQAKDEREQAQEAAQIQWLQNKERRLHAN